MDNISKYTLPKGSHIVSPKHDYKVVDVLGKGGFGITYKVSTTIQVGNIPINTFFCIKEHFISDICARDNKDMVVVSEPLNDKYKESAETFRSEAERLNSLSGKINGIVRVNEVFEANNTIYYVMEYLDGYSLHQSVEMAGVYDEDKAISMVSQIAEALQSLHLEHIAHLDIKPDNVMLCKSGDNSVLEPVLIDFGLAKHYDNKGKPTSAIKVQGCSEGYSPIEQYVELDVISPATDVYALAATLFFLLTGKNPKIATQVTEQYIRESLPTTLHSNVTNAIVAAMKKEKRDRTQSVENFIKQLKGEETEHEFVVTAPVSTKSIDVHEREKIAKKHYVAVSIVFLILGYFCASMFNNADKEVETENELASEVIQLNNDNENTAVDSAVDNQSVIAEIAATSDNKIELQKKLDEYLAKSDSLCSEAEMKHGDKAMIQVILDAKFYYYTKANSVNEKLNGKKLKPSNRIAKLVRREYEYWIDKGNNAGRHRKDYAQKKAYYENAYKLVNSDRLKTYIVWLDSHMEKR